VANNEWGSRFGMKTSSSIAHSYISRQMSWNLEALEDQSCYLFKPREKATARINLLSLTESVS
jgi:hypothetical protein